MKLSNKKIKYIDAAFGWGMVVIPFLAPLIFLRGLRDFANLPQSAFIQIGAALLLLTWLIKGFMQRECLILKSPFNLPILAFVLWGFVSLAYAHNKYEGFSMWIHWAASALMYFLVINSGCNRRDMVRLLAAVFVSGSLCAMLGIVQHFFGFSWVPQARPPAATFANKNMAVHFIILALPLGVGLFLDQNRRISKQLVCLASAAMITFLVCTRSRAAMVVLVVEGILLPFILVGAGKRKMSFRLAVVCLAVTAAMALAVRKDFNVSSIELRMAIWRNTLEMIKERPLAGYGLGNHKIFHPLYHRKVAVEESFGEGAQLDNVHNDYLQVFAELGAVGIILLGWIGFVLMMVARRLTSSRQAPDVRTWATGITTGVVGLLVNALFCFPFQRAIPPFVLMAFMGVLGSLYAGENRRSYRITQRWIPLLACVFASIVLMSLVRFHYRGIKSDRHFLRVTQLEEARDWRGVVAEGEKAYEYDPGRVRILSHMGRAYMELGEPRKGIEASQKVAAAYPNLMNVWFNIGLASDRIGDDKGALEAYEKVLLIKPDYAKAHNNIANIYMKQNNLNKALQSLRLAAEFDPGNSVIHSNIGIIEVQRGEYEAAANAFEKAAHLRPGWDLAERDSLSENRREVIEHLRTVLELNPGIKEEDQIRRLIEVLERL